MRSFPGDGAGRIRWARVDLVRVVRVEVINMGMDVILKGYCNVRWFVIDVR